MCQQMSLCRLGNGGGVSWREPWIQWTAQLQSMQPRKLLKLPAGGCCTTLHVQDLNMLSGLMTQSEGNTGLQLLHVRWPTVRCVQAEAEHRGSQGCCIECDFAAPAVGQPCGTLAERLRQSHASCGMLLSLRSKSVLKYQESVQTHCLCHA